MVAHQVEQQTENLCVVGSSPTVATIYKETTMAIVVVLVIFVTMYFFIRKL